MARRGMSLVTYNRFKIVAFIVFFVIIIQIIRVSPWFQTFNPADIDHGPSSDGVFLPVSVEVFYEALCPDSKSFIVRQLRPVIEKAPRLVAISFIPYGKATTHVSPSGNITFECQHGPTECFANKIHACAVNIIGDELKQVEYVSCMISDNYDPIKAGKTCAVKMNIDWVPIEKCSLAKEANVILKENGELTDALYPRVKFIPTVLLDNSQRNQARILKNLFGEICGLFKVTPTECQEQETIS